MAAAAAPRLLLGLASSASFALTAAVGAFLEPGLGLATLLFVPVALAALAGDRVVGAAAGLLASALYVAGVLLSPELTRHDLARVSTLSCTLAYVAVGVLVGWSASNSRTLVAGLRDLAERDALTGLANVRPFEAELGRRSREAAPFALLVAELEALGETSDRDGYAAGNALLRRTAHALDELAGDGDVTARIGGCAFALLVAAASAEETAALAARFEHELERRRLRVSVGWAFHPLDGRRPADLLQRADERLARARAARRSREVIAGLLTGAIAPSA